MDSVTAYISPAAALLGVLLGGLLTTRTQATIHRQTIAAQTLKQKQDAAVEFLAAIRAFRRFAMYSPADFDEVAKTETSKGVVTFEGRAEYDVRMDTAAARLMIVIHSDKMNALASEMRSTLNSFLRSRAQLGKGNVPNEVIRNLQHNEQRFAQLAVLELGGIEININPEQYV